MKIAVVFFAVGWIRLNVLAIARVGSNTRTSLYSVADTLYNDMSFAPQGIVHCAKLVSLEGASALYCYHLTAQIR